MIDEQSTPIFIKIKEKLKDDIMAGVYEEDELIISTTQIAKFYAVNLGTAGKSINLLSEEGIVYKKRGIGMCVTKEAKEIIVKQRTEEFHGRIITYLVSEAKKLGINREQLIQIIKGVEDYD